MAEQVQNAPICQNGHKQPAAGTKFCIYCGVPVLTSQPPQPVQNAVSPQQMVAPPLAQNVAAQQPVTPVASQPQQFQQQQYQQPPIQQMQYQPRIQPVICRTCGGYGQGLPEKAVVCKECRWLRPIVPGYQVDSSAFAWAADAKAMAVLRSMTPLNAAAKAVSEKVGRRWVEVSFNGVLLGEKQMPQIYGQAVRAARILGMSHMPDVYLSGERPWDMLTFGSDKDSFVVVGSALAGNFQAVDMLFLLAREMGHCRAGHALWKTVIRFFLGEQGPAKGFMAGGIFNAILSPTALVGGAIEMPLLAWARQAEITADRAGMLAVGNEEVARRVLLSWSLKSSFMYRQLNIDAWLEQQSEEDDSYSKLSELTTSSTPYLGPRLKLLSQYAQSEELKRYLSLISETIKRASPQKPLTNPSTDVVRIKCSGCGKPLRIPKTVLEGKTQLPVKCPDPGCAVITVIKKNAKPLKAVKAAEERARNQENMNYAD